MLFLCSVFFIRFQFVFQKKKKKKLITRGRSNCLNGNNFTQQLLCICRYVCVFGGGGCVLCNMRKLKKLLKWRDFCSHHTTYHFRRHGHKYGSLSASFFLLESFSVSPSHSHSQFYFLLCFSPSIEHINRDQIFTSYFVCVFVFFFIFHFLYDIYSRQLYIIPTA